MSKHLFKKGEIQNWADLIIISENFKEVQVEFGVKLDVEAGALIAKTGVEATINVTLTWERE